MTKKTANIEFVIVDADAYTFNSNWIAMANTKKSLIAGKIQLIGQSKTTNIYYCGNQKSLNRLNLLLQKERKYIYGRNAKPFRIRYFVEEWLRRSARNRWVSKLRENVQSMSSKYAGYSIGNRPISSRILGTAWTGRSKRIWWLQTKNLIKISKYFLIIFPLNLIIIWHCRQLQPVW